MSIAQDWRGQLLVEYSKNQHACEVFDGTMGDDRDKVMNDVIYSKDRIYLFSGSQLREKIMQVVKDSPLAGHQGFLKTYKAIRQRSTWRGLKGHVLRHVQESDVC